MLNVEEGVLGRRDEGTPSSEATLLTAATEVRGKALEKIDYLLQPYYHLVSTLTLEKRCCWNWEKCETRQSGSIRQESSHSRFEVNIGDTDASNSL